MDQKNNIDKPWLSMWNRFTEKQIDICNDYGFEPSDCFFLATTKDKYYRRRRRMKNDDNARICIAPLINI